MVVLTEPCGPDPLGQTDAQDAFDISGHLSLDQQVSVRGLVMGPGTPYCVPVGFNPFTVSNMTNTRQRTWGHGSWGPAQWTQERKIPVPVWVQGRNIEDWTALHWRLADAFRPLEDEIQLAELRFMWAGTEYVAYGAPRMVEPSMEEVYRGKSLTKCGFTGRNPFVYSGNLYTAGPLHLPTVTGGLTVPFTVPFVIDASQVTGSTSILNGGTVATGMTIIIYGPVLNPRYTLVGPYGQVWRQQLHTFLSAGQYVVIDTQAETVLLNGEVSRRGRITGGFPLLKPGRSIISYGADQYNSQTQMTVEYRYAWR